MKPHCFLFVYVALLLLSRKIAIALDEASDQDALIALKSKIVSGPSRIVTDSWSTNVSVCSWIGVTCNASPRRVVAINFSGFGLRGTLAPEIGNLSSLRTLGLRENSFTGPVPLELSKLRLLEVIDLGFNAFVERVPPWLGTMGGKMEQIFLNNNNFTGSIPRSLGNNTKLRVLNLAYNFLDGVIPQEIGNLSSLEALVLRNNSQITSSIPSSIFNLSNIKVISLSGNSLSGPLPDYMCGGITRLRELDLSENLLSGKIPNNIHKCNKLHDLDLSNNHFSGNIPNSIGWLTNLQTLILGLNTFQDGIPMEIGNLSSLEVLRIHGAFLRGQIPSFIFNMSSLTWLDLSNNTLRGSLPPNVCRDLPKLERLNLQRNLLSGQVLNNIHDCPSLSVLALSRNEFTGHIPKHVGNLTSLVHLLLSTNHFTGEVPTELGNLNARQIIAHTNNLSGTIPTSIFNISSIETIEFSSNNLVGQLPSTLGFWLPNLLQLSLDGNKLNGSIPTSIANLSSLTLINLGDNHFSGPMPNLGSLHNLQQIFIGENDITGESPGQELGFITSLTNCRLLNFVEMSLNPLQGKLPPSIGNFSEALEKFKMFGCGISGSIPATIGNLSSLIGLYLDMNELTGFIPDSIGELSQLERIYLEENMLEGVIPSGLCKLERLGDFFMSVNRLRGPIPSCIGEMKSLIRLYLDSNKLESSVPSGLWNITTLLELNLSMNGFSGLLATEVANLKSLWMLDVSWNRFLGNIPASIGSAESLTNLSLARNKFDGSIPRSIGNLKGLVSLDLSFNDLSGQIPNSLETLEYLNQFNVSYNRLEGPIPTKGSFVNFTYRSFANNSGLCGATHLQLIPPCKGSTPNKARPKNMIIYILTPCMLTLVAMIVIISILRRRRTVKRAQDIEAALLPTWRGSSYLELQRATNAFSEGNLLGRGGFGSVYAGKLSDDLIVAVKVFDLQSQEVAKSFDTEIEVLKEIRHRNLLKVIGCCSNLDFKALIYEYMPNGSLEKRLYSHNHFLDLLQRLNIAIDVASALEYLHHGLTVPVVHRDLKPSNILLDGEMTACVGDFGIAKIFDEGVSIAQTETLATVGYMAPEYGAQGIVSTSADVYSFGVVLLEMFTRKKPTDEIFSEDTSLVKWVSLSLHEGSAMTNCADANLLEGDEDRNFSKKEQCLFSVMSLAMECSAISPSERIKMSEVVPNLKKIRAMFLAN